MRRGWSSLLGPPVRSRKVPLRWQHREMHGLLSSRQAAGRLGVHMKTIQRWVREGRLPDYRNTDEQYWFYPEDVDALLTPLGDSCSQDVGMSHEYYANYMCGSREIADYLGTSIKTIQRWADAGRLPAWRLVNQYLRFRRGDVEAILTPLR